LIDEKWEVKEIWSSIIQMVWGQYRSWSIFNKR
jgi:hypothetical protein